MKTYIPAIMLSAFSFFLASFFDSLDCIARYAHSLFKEIYSKIIQKSSQVGSINSKMMKTNTSAIILSAFSFFLAYFSDSLDCIARYAHSLFKEICSKTIQKSSQYNL